MSSDANIRPAFKAFHMRLNFIVRIVSMKPDFTKIQMF
jgi:hypothetical protein